MALSQNTLKKIKRLFLPPKDVNAMLKSILVPTANGKPQTASSRFPFAVNSMLKVPTVFILNICLAALHILQVFP